MNKKSADKQRGWLIFLIVLCLCIVISGGVGYVTRLRNNLQENAIQNVMTVTLQQRQAFDNFIAGDRERLHSFAEYYAAEGDNTPEEIQRQLKIFNEVDAVYSVLCLDDGWFCSNLNAEIRSLTEENIRDYSGYTDSGVRSSYIGLFSGEPKFGFYEAFTFKNGHRGLIQKSYSRAKISEEFSLSFYNGQGLAYIIDTNGEILLRSTGTQGNELKNNIFELLNDQFDQHDRIEEFIAALNANETGTVIFTGKIDEWIYTYVPIESVDGWYLISIVPETAITEETDRMLMDSKMAVGLLAFILTLCGVSLLLIWRTQHDIKEKNHEIEYQEQLFQIFATYLSSNTSDVFLMLDAGTKTLEFVSSNVERVLGVGREDVLDMLLASDMAADPEGAQAYSDQVKALKVGEKAEERRSERTNPKTGERHYFLETVYCTAIQDKPKLVFYISDRTEERTTQDALTEALHIAQSANNAKTTFLGSVSHDIRTPMNAIMGMVTLLREDANDPDQVLDYAQRIDSASQHLLGLINDVLDMNKIESGSATLNLSEINLASIIDEINTIIRPQTKAKNQTFEIFSTPFNHEYLLGDKLRINQILINLLSNAVKYTQAGGDIQLRVEERAQVVENYSRVRFTVSDNGMGMSEEYQKIIFDPFTREETAATRQIQGTGLGMAITKSLVDLMGGTIDVKSTLGEGSVFTLELELYIQEREDDPKFWSRHKVTRMIVADDDEDVCRNIVRAMNVTGVAVDYATDGETALRMMRDNRKNGRPYDLILLDWKMPDLDGLETARRIREKYSEKIPILLLTAYDWGEIEQEAKEIGVNHFVPKPFFMSTFKEAIHRIMNKESGQTSSITGDMEGNRILVVDDIEVNRLILVKILSSMGAECDVAENGQEAVKIFEASRPGDYDVILMDVQMPMMDGYTATRTIRSGSHPQAKTVPIIAMTANAFVDDVRDAIDSGMNAHVAKPIQVDKLKAAIAQVLGEGAGVQAEGNDERSTEK